MNLEDEKTITTKPTYQKYEKRVPSYTTINLDKDKIAEFLEKPSSYKLNAPLAPKELVCLDESISIEEKQQSNQDELLFYPYNEESETEDDAENRALYFENQPQFRESSTKGAKTCEKSNSFITLCLIQILICLCLILVSNYLKSSSPLVFTEFKEAFNFLTQASFNIKELAGGVTEVAQTISSEAITQDLGSGGGNSAKTLNYSDDTLAHELLFQLPETDIAFATPIEAYTITSDYGFREHPISGNLNYHTGIDLACASGTDILSTLEGVVTEVDYSDIYGDYIVVKHAVGIYSMYGHCSEVTVEVGDKVERLGVIGKVGSTGLSTGPHLHFELSRDGKSFNPTEIMEF